MTPDQLAALHAQCFTRPPPWPASAFVALRDSPGVHLLTRGQAFLLWRITLDEAEILTLAVAPDARRQGLGAALVADFLRQAQALGATRALLEVAADNAPARALYDGAGFAQAGIRRGYYAPTQGQGAIDALTLCKAL